MYPYAIQFAEWPLLVSSYVPFVPACNLCNPPILPRPGKAKLGEDHPQTLVSLNYMAFLLRAQGRLVEAEPLYREALEKSLGAQLQRSQWDFGQWIWSHTLLELRRVIRLLMAVTGAAILLGYLRMVLACFPKVPKVAFIPKHVMANALNSPKCIDFCLVIFGDFW